MNKSENAVTREINRRIEILEKYMQDPSLRDYWQRFQKECNILKGNLQNVSEVAKRMVAEEAQEYYEKLVAINGDTDKLSILDYHSQGTYTHLEVNHPSVQRLIKQLNINPLNNAFIDPTVRDEFIQSVYEGEGYTEILPRTSEIIEEYRKLKSMKTQRGVQLEETQAVEKEILTKALQVGLTISGTEIMPAGQDLISISAGTKSVGTHEKVAIEDFEDIYYNTRNEKTLGIQDLTAGERTEEEQR